MSQPVPPLGSYGVVQTKGFLGALIRLATRSRYSHAFIYIGRAPGMPYAVVEAQAAGAQLSPLGKYAGRRIAWNDQEPLTGSQRLGVVVEARKLLGTPYGYLDIFDLALESLGIHSKRLRRRVAAEQALICSQLVARAYRLGGGVDVKPGGAEASVTPGDLADRITRRAWES